MPLGIDKYIFRFQVAICDAFLLMQKLKNQNNFRRVELGCGFVESSRSSEIAKYFASRAIVKLLGMSVQFLRCSGLIGSCTSMYNESSSWKLATMVVMKGWPATAASTLRSFRTCSTCLSRITVTLSSASCMSEEVRLHISYPSGNHIPSTFRKILSANTLFSSSFWAFVSRTSHTRANVPRRVCISGCVPG